MLVSDDFAVLLNFEAAGTTEVVGVRVGDEHRVDRFDRVSGTLQSGGELLVGVGARQARVDQRDAACILEHIAVHVPEPGQHDRQLDAHDPGRDLGRFVIGGELLLLQRNTFSRQ